MSSYESDLALALRLADLADSIALPRFLAQDLVVETKPDNFSFITVFFLGLCLG